MQKDTGKTLMTDSRGEHRIECQENASVEFIPGKKTILYHFRLKNFSSKGFGFVVRKDSQLLKHIRVGDIFTMKYHPEEATVNPATFRTQIKHISEPEPGKYRDHMLVGLLILE